MTRVFYLGAMKDVLCDKSTCEGHLNRSWYMNNLRLYYPKQPEIPGIRSRILKPLPLNIELLIVETLNEIRSKYSFRKSFNGFT